MVDIGIQGRAVEAVGRTKDRRRRGIVKSWLLAMGRCCEKYGVRWQSESLSGDTAFEWGMGLFGRGNEEQRKGAKFGEMGWLRSLVLGEVMGFSR
jgi:hypothetical protein